MAKKSSQPRPSLRPFVVSGEAAAAMSRMERRSKSCNVCKTVYQKAAHAKACQDYHHGRAGL